MSSNWSGLKDVTLFAIAIWGAALSTFNFGYERYKNRRNVKVLLSTVISFELGGGSTDYYKIEVVNAGPRPITISHTTLEMPDGQWFANVSDVLPNTTLPVTLTEGQIASAHFDAEFVRSGLRRKYGSGKVRPITQDSLRNFYRGKKFNPLK